MTLVHTAVKPGGARVGPDIAVLVLPISMAAGQEHTV